MRAYVVSIAGSFLAGALVSAWICLRPLPLPPLAEGLASDFIEADQQFKQRVRTHFAEGMLEKDLIRELVDQGFSPKWELRPNWRAAAYKRFGFPCVLEWVVLWRVDEQGLVREIDAKLPATGCI